MIKTYHTNTHAYAARVEGDLYELCEYLVDNLVTKEAHPMWKMPGGFQEGVDPNAIMLWDYHHGWVEADEGDYILNTPSGARHVPGDIFEMFFTPQ